VSSSAAEADLPELLEVEYYRRLAERGALDRRIAGVDAPDAWFLKRGLDADTLRAALQGARFKTARRIGKLMLLDTERRGRPGPVLGLRFGMTGRLIVDAAAGIEHLEYASARDEPAWDRVTIRFADGGDVRIRDPRRLGAVELDPDEDRMGLDAMTVSAAGLRDALSGSAAPLKARLMDQQRIAGMGNLLTDETLWRAGLDPARPAGSLTPAETRRLHRHLRRTVDELLTRGGSHMGDLQIARVRGGICPRDGAALERRTVGGRTTYSCPVHQR
jgi:formamidopyrimidine-DNA glycosylase